MTLDNQLAKGPVYSGAARRSAPAVAENGNIHNDHVRAYDNHVMLQPPWCPMTRDVVSRRQTADRTGIT